MRALAIGKWDIDTLIPANKARRQMAGLHAAEIVERSGLEHPSV
jgi:hypothetical protein